MLDDYNLRIIQIKVCRYREFLREFLTMSTTVPVSWMLIMPAYTLLQSEFVDAVRNMASAPDGPLT